MSILSEGWDDITGVAAQRNAIAGQQQSARDQLAAMTSLFNSLKGQQADAYGTAKSDLTTGLNNFYSASKGPLMDLLTTVREQGRNFAAQSGLIGGGQEAMAVEPTVQKVANQAQQDWAGMLVNGLQNLNLANMNGINSLAGASLNGMNNAGNTYTDTLGQYASGGLAPLLSLLNTGVNAYGAFSGKKK
jgi:hypothetical protein